MESSLEIAAPQRSDAWRLQRAGKVTASRVADVIARTQKGWGAARNKYMEQLIAERLTGRPQDMRQVRSMTERADMEPDARAAYTFYTGNEVELVGFIDHPTILNSGSSPDGHVGSEGMLEIKCLDAATHVKLLSGDESVLLDYLPQIHFGMACTGRAWCDFESFSPLMLDEDMKVYIRRVPRDTDVIKKLEDAIKDFLAELDARLAKLKK